MGLILLVLMAATVADGINITSITPTETKQLIEGKTQTVVFNFTCTSVGDQLLEFNLNNGGVTYVIAKITQNQLIFCSSTTISQTGNFTIEGVFIGKTKLSAMIRKDNVSVDTQPKTVTGLQQYKISVIRPPSNLYTVFTIVVVILVVTNTIGFGCNLDIDVLKNILKRPLAPGVGFVCQYAFMPLIAFSLTKIFSMEKDFGLGLFAIGCSPGGGASNMWTLLLNGDFDLSMTMTFLSTFTALGLMPLWMLTLGRTYVDADITIPYENIIISLTAFVVPGAIGLLIRRFRPKAADFIRKLIKPFSALIILFILTFGIYSNLYMFKIMTQWRFAVSAILLPYTGFLLSGMVAFAFRLPWKRIKTIMIETAIQNTGLPIILLRYTFPQPEGDLSSAMPVLSIMFVPVALWIALLYITVRDRCCQRGAKKFELEEELQEKGIDGPQQNEETIQNVNQLVPKDFEKKNNRT